MSSSSSSSSSKSSSSKSSSSSSSKSSSSSSSLDPSSFPSSSSLSSEMEYEFTERQNAVIAQLADSMVWVTLPLLIVGVLYAIGLLVSVVRSFHDPQFIVQAALVGLAMLFFLATARWTKQSAQAFSKIVSTEGHDIDHLMKALENLGKIFGVLSLIVKIYVVIVGIAVVTGLIAALAAAFKI
jgi:hypothetical protein